MRYMTFTPRLRPLNDKPQVTVKEIAAAAAAQLGIPTSEPSEP